MENQQPLPSDEYAERSFLASIAAPGNEDVAHLCHPLLSSDDFTVPFHAAMFSGVGQLLASKVEVNSITLRNAMSGLVGHGYEEHTLYSAILDVLGAEEVGRPSVLAEIIRRRTLQRRLIRIGGHLQAEGYRDLEPHEVASRASEALRNLEAGRSNRVNGRRILERIERGEAFAEEGAGSKLLYWGLPTLTSNVEAAQGHLVVLGARPKCGKSALAVQALCRTASRGIESLFISLEMDQDECQARIAGHLTGEGYQAFRSASYGRDAEASVKSEIVTLNHLNIFFAPSGIDISRVEVEIRDAARAGVRLVVIDYFQLIAYHVGRNGTEASALAVNVTKLKRLAQELRICILLLAQINRDAGNSEIPQSSSLKGTGSLEQDANAIILLWRDKAENAWFKISDNRSGPAGFAQVVSFDGSTNRFTEIERTT